MLRCQVSLVHPGRPEVGRVGGSHHRLIQDDFLSVAAVHSSCYIIHSEMSSDKYSEVIPFFLLFCFLFVCSKKFDNNIGIKKKI